jgi:hypothetical protein
MEPYRKMPDVSLEFRTDKSLSKCDKARESVESDCPIASTFGIQILKKANF